MTRGQKGCYIFCTDAETNEYFKRAAGESGKQETFNEVDPFDRLPFEILARHEVKPFVDAVPVLDLKIAAGDFSEEQWLEQDTWVKLPEPFSVKPGYFVAQVVGNSMNRRIPDRSWCLFRSDPGGSRNGKVVLVQNRNSQDPDAGRYTIKVYHSDKVAENNVWHHTRITLKPDSTDLKYKPIILEGEDAGELKVLGLFVAVLA
jgi:phage repressor protein C with HTH and peptisase S24 domain